MIFPLLVCYAVYVGSFFTDVSEQTISSVFKVKLSLENGTDKLSRNVGKNYRHTLRNNPK
jgi:hypothetical protein